MRELEEHPCLVVAAIEGYCLGGGLELALACDARIAGTSATFGLPEVGRDLLPTWGGHHRLARVIGLGRAKELVLLGRRLGAADALATGLVTEVVVDGAAREPRARRGGRRRSRYRPGDGGPREGARHRRIRRRPAHRRAARPARGGRPGVTTVLPTPPTERRPVWTRASRSTGRRLLITGAASGMGRSFAELAAADGAHVGSARPQRHRARADRRIARRQRHPRRRRGRPQRLGRHRGGRRRAGAPRWAGSTRSATSPAGTRRAGSGSSRTTCGSG